MKRIIALYTTLVMFGATAAYAEEAKIDIKNHAFTPKEITIPAGSTITWTNHDQDPHTVSDSDPQKRFHSAALDTNEHYSFTFTKSGTYAYFCTLHLDMVGTITVK